MHIGSAFRPKKSVVLSGSPAGNTAICTVGQSGNDLRYRGYDIVDLAAHCEVSEVSYLLVHGKLPTTAELAAYKERLLGRRTLPKPVLHALEQIPAHAHPMDVLRTGVSVLGCVRPEAIDHNEAGTRELADGLLASLPSMLLYCTTTRTTARASQSTPQASRWRNTSCIYFMASRPVRTGSTPCRFRSLSTQNMSSMPQPSLRAS